MDVDFFARFARAAHSTYGDPLLSWFALALIIIGLAQTGLGLFGPQKAQEDM